MQVFGDDLSIGHKIPALPNRSVHAMGHISLPLLVVLHGPTTQRQLNIVLYLRYRVFSRTIDRDVLSSS